MRMGGLAIGILVAVLVPAGSALAANQTVAALTNPDVFAPAAVTVVQGDTVTWTNSSSAPHNVHFYDGFFTKPDVVDPPWTVSWTFTSVGTFSYVCQVHSPGMAGTVTVQAAGTTPGPGPGGGPPPSVTADKVKPSVTLSGRTTQKVLTQRAVLVAVAVNEASSVAARGSVSVPGSSKIFRLRKASKQLAAGAKATLKLKLSKQASRSFRRALARRARLTAKLTITAKDAAGNVRSAKRAVRLKR